MTTPSILGTNTIQNNVITDGYVTNGSVSTEYLYTSAISVTSSTNIIGNVLSGTATASRMLDLSNGSSLVQGNKFIRGNVSINSYVTSSTSNDQIIIDNIFDSSTTNGASTTLVNNLSSGSNFTRNKNQIGYAIIPLATDKSSIFGFGTNTISILNSSVVPATFTSDTGVYSQYLHDRFLLKVYDSTVTPAPNYFSMGVDISKSLPMGVKILDAKLSLYNRSGIALDTAATNNFNIALSAGRNHLDSINIATYFSGGNSSLMLGYNAVSTLVVNAGNEASMHSTYQAIDLPTTGFTGSVTDGTGTTSSVSNLDISGNYVTGKDYNITANIMFNYKAAAQGLVLTVSPLIITYIW